MYKITLTHEDEILELKLTHRVWDDALEGELRAAGRFQKFTLKPEEETNLIIAQP